MSSEPPVNGTVHNNLLDQVDDGTSSSLSDPGDRTGNEDAEDAQDPEVDGSDAYDTEAETERLEKTPRKQRNVLLTSSTGSCNDREGLAADQAQIEGSPNRKLCQHGETTGKTGTVADHAAVQDPDQVSDSSLEETGDEDDAPPSPSSSRKRKRSEIDLSSKEEKEVDQDSHAKASKPSRSPSLSSVGSPNALAEDENHLSETRVPEPTSKQSHKKGKRKGRKIKDEEIMSKGERAAGPETLEEAADHAEAASSNGEEVEMEDVGEGDGADADSAAKTEESRKSHLEDTLSIP